MSKSVIMSPPGWDRLNARLVNDHKPSIMLIREKMRRVLGFTVRTHNYYNTDDDYYVEEVHLDFYDEAKRTMFLLKYSEYLDEKVR